MKYQKEQLRSLKEPLKRIFTGKAYAGSPDMKMTTPIPPGIATPDKLETRLGNLNLSDGVPDRETTRIIYDNLDFQRGVQTYLNSIQIASMDALRKGITGFGPPNTTVLLFENLMDSKALWLTPNTTSIYMTSWLQLDEEPYVIETPPDVLGIIDDHWFKHVTDFGNTGPDNGKGGKFLILPPGYDGDIPEGYYVASTNTWGNWLLWRGFQVDGMTAPAIRATRETFKIYPLSKQKDPPKMNFINVSGVFHNTIHSTDYAIFDEINEVIQAEPGKGMDVEILGQLASIGIRKGHPFEPDDRMKAILKEAADVASTTVRALLARPRGEEYYLYPGENHWSTGFISVDHNFLSQGIRMLDCRCRFHFYATGITPAMVSAPVGKGSQYAVAYLDAEENPFDGGKTYKIHIPPNVPAKDFWSLTLYDNQTRSLLQTDQQFPGIDNLKENLKINGDGSFDIYFGPQAPAGKEDNWIQTIPGKGWNILFRLYGPLEPWFDKTWRPEDIKLFQHSLQ